MGAGVVLQDLSLVYRWDRFQREVFTDFNLQVEPGSFLTVVGSNGSGKSSLLKLILGLIPPTSGMVSLDGEPVQYGQMQNAQNGRIAYLSQEVRELYFHGTVAEEWLAAGLSLDSLPPEIEPWFNRSTETLSGGEAQLLGMHLFMHRPAPLMLMDEPSSYLDAQHIQILKSKLLEYHSLGSTIIHVTQYEGETAWGTHRLDLSAGEASP